MTQIEINMMKTVVVIYTFYLQFLEKQMILMIIKNVVENTSKAWTTLYLIHN
jgi:hypothetical protein